MRSRKNLDKMEAIKPLGGARSHTSASDAADGHPPRLYDIPEKLSPGLGAFIAPSSRRARWPGRPEPVHWFENLPGQRRLAEKLRSGGLLPRSYFDWRF